MNQSNSNTSMDDYAVQLRRYNWSGNRDYQLAVIAFKELFTSALKAREEGLLGELSVLIGERPHNEIPHAVNSFIASKRELSQTPQETSNA